MAHLTGPQGHTGGKTVVQQKGAGNARGDEQIGKGRGILGDVPPEQQGGVGSGPGVVLNDHGAGEAGEPPHILAQGLVDPVVAGVYHQSAQLRIHNAGDAEADPGDFLPGNEVGFQNLAD